MTRSGTLENYFLRTTFSLYFNRVSNNGMNGFTQLTERREFNNLVYVARHADSLEILGHSQGNTYSALTDITSV